MTFLSSSADAEQTNPTPLTRAVAMTGRAVRIALGAISDDPDRIPPGRVAMGAFLNGHHVGTTSADPRAFADLMTVNWAETPVFVCLSTAAEPGQTVMGTLWAYVPVTVLPWLPQSTMNAQSDAWEAKEAELDPWARAARGFEAVREMTPDDFEPVEPPPVPIYEVDGVECGILPLGSLVRYDKVRKYPADLALEAQDMLAVMFKGLVKDRMDAIIEMERL